MDEILRPEFLARLKGLRARVAGALARRVLGVTHPQGRRSTPEFRAHRDYAPGDDLRYIDWNLYARLGRFFIKSTEREQEGVLHVLLDVSRSMSVPHAEKGVRSAEIAAALGYLGLCAGAEVHVAVWSEKVLRSAGPFHGERRALPLLEALARMAPGGKTHLENSLGGLLRSRVLRGSTVVLISDFIDTSRYGRNVDYITASGSALGAVQVLHPAETDLRLRGHLSLEDPESPGEAGPPLLVGYARLRELRRQVEEFLASTDRFFRRRTSRFVRTESTEPFEDAVVRYLLAAEGAP